ncbi:CPBP family intramembrane glutamic endopeptidase [Geodermatophilus sp. CPCC 206100]|uniref:CPBP family intramembrane glutamic endopeptidase n=1 Tax=Geodermatophilus sp. CPCC 206100 TaxID=3020054 RepID=UPI003AFFF2DC
MHGHPAAGRRVVVLAASSVVLAGTWNNLVLPRLPGPYAVVNGAASAVLLTAARAAGLTWAELGLARGALPAGARHGGAWAAAVAAAYGTALAVPALRPLLGDARTAGLTRAQLATQVLVRIPLGTVVWEELVFRGVLPAVLRRLGPPARAEAGAAALFGLWHVRPTLDALAVNGVAPAPAVRGLLVLAGCGATAGAGLLFCRLRQRSGSLLAPALLHLAANALGALASAAATRPRAGARGSRRR